MNKRMKKLTAVLLSAVMALSAAMPAAAESFTITNSYHWDGEKWVEFSSDTGSTISKTDRASLLKKLKSESGWVELEGSWYFVKDGEPVTGWLKDGGKWYYLDADGVMQTGWLNEGGVTYYLSGSGAMKTGWVQVEGSWYFFGGSGAMKTGWLQQGSKWYYLSPQNGVMATGTRTIGGKTHSFNSSGVGTGETAAATNPAGGIKNILNSAPLHPQYSVSDRLNKDVGKLMDAILTDDMDTYTKVRTVFDYMIENYTYGLSGLDILLNDEEMFALYFSGGTNEYMAVEILETGVGVCDNYSAAFAAVMRAIGLDCEVVYGVAYTTSGSGSGHAWTVITVNGTEYIFDPQIEQNIALRDGTVHYYRFGPTYASIPGRYDVSGYIPFLS